MKAGVPIGDDAAAMKRYIVHMSKAAATQPRTTMVPVTTMEVMPMPNDAERAEMIASLERSEAAIAAGRGAAHDARRFVADMQAKREAAKQTPNA